MSTPIDDIRKLVSTCLEYNGEDLPKFRARTTGPHWPVLRRYAALIDGAQRLIEYIDELTEVIEEQDAKEQAQTIE